MAILVDNAKWCGFCVKWQHLLLTTAYIIRRD